MITNALPFPVRHTDPKVVDELKSAIEALDGLIVDALANQIRKPKIRGVRPETVITDETTRGG